MRGVISTAILAFITYIIFTGSAKPYDLFTGLIVAVGVGILVGKFLVKEDSKALNPLRWIWAVIYFLKYMLIIEVKTHLDVMKRVITGKYNAGIVRVPINVKTDYAKTLVANSITNTPGTVVVDLDDKCLYVNWIDVTTEDPKACRREISEEFEKFAEKIFE